MLGAPPRAAHGALLEEVVTSRRRSARSPPQGYHRHEEAHRRGTRRWPGMARRVEHGRGRVLAPTAGEEQSDQHLPTQGASPASDRRERWGPCSPPRRLQIGERGGGPIVHR
jgi:hypothetical protein